MRTFLWAAFVTVLGCNLIFGAPMCVSGNLQTFTGLGSAGCDVGDVNFMNFTLLPGEAFGNSIPPAEVQISLGGTASSPLLIFTLNKTASAGAGLESFVRFTANGPLTGVSIALTSPTVTGDAAVTGILDVCADASFQGASPVGCPTSSSSLIAFALNQSSLLSNSASLPASRSYDAFVDLTLDGGRSGSALVNSANVGFSTAASAVPEPSSGLLAALGLLALVVPRARRRSRVLSTRTSRGVK